MNEPWRIQRRQHLRRAPHELRQVIVDAQSIMRREHVKIVARNRINYPGLAG